jgi:DNA repair exonuclease SbcCD nuclease subunit
MKIALITDQHYGCRNDNMAILDYQKKFFDDVFFPDLVNNEIMQVFCLGDLVDRRKFININTANRLRKDFIEPLVDSERTIHIIPGNHDVFFKNSNDVNILNEFLGSTKNVHIYMDPTEVSIGKADILMLPWICEENEEACMKAIRETKAPILFGHLQLIGFEMHKGIFSETGLDKSVFDKFDTVASGHFHHKSSYQNIHYLGNPYEMTWADYGEVKGYHFFDTDTYELTFKRNPLKLFNKLVYSDANTDYDSVLRKDYSYISNTYVKVIVKQKSNPFLYDRFIQKLDEQNPIDIKAVDDHLNIVLDSDTEIIEQADSTLDILSKTIEQVEIDEKYKSRLEGLLVKLYNEAAILES